ncbi:MAG: ABC transporter ATP-binding protein/permease [Bacilli bacterium]|nr:ABC transporter ATP-binding protein/permease [Bacilli bacterium]
MKALTPLRKYRFRVFLAPALKAVECICELVIPFIVRAIIDEGLNPNGTHAGDAGFVLVLCAAVFGLSVFGFACTMVTQYVASSVSTRFSEELRMNIYAHIGELSPYQLEEYGKSKALNLMTSSSSSLQSGVQMFMRLLVRAPFLVVGSIIAAFIVNVYAGWVVLGALALCALVIGIVVKVTPKRYTSLMNELDAISRLGDDLITGSRVVRAFNKQEDAQREFEDESENYRGRALRLSRINAFINPLTFGFVNLAVILVLYLGSFAYENTLISVGSIVALVSFLTQSLNALIQFTRLVTSFSKALADKKRIDGFLAIEPSIVDGPLQEEPLIEPGEDLFSLKDASVSFGGENYALDRVNLSISRGSRVGIIGGTGSGKSTLLSLLCRFLDPTSGVVEYRGHDMRESRLENFRGSIALVSQKPQFFQGTIRENLSMGQVYSDEAIDEALRDALAYEFVHGKEGGLDAIVEEGGTNYSGGQKQRLLIARALLSQREVLILDDATSALDYKSDMLVRRNISRREGLTTVLVSQRATSVKDCDRIYVLDQGRIVGEGKHEELLKDCPIYAEIYEAQVKTR